MWSSTQITIANTPYHIAINQPISISLTLGKDKAKAWYQQDVSCIPFIFGDTVMAVSKGASVNFNQLTIAPHAHTTHTECVGHISTEPVVINQVVTQYFHLAMLITVTPVQTIDGDFQITKEIIKHAFLNVCQSQNYDATFIQNVNTLVIRTQPNTIAKKNHCYDHTNWAYFTKDAIVYIREMGIVHLLVDTPSVDKEDDKGVLVAHKAFWNYPQTLCLSRTITELIYVPNTVIDQVYVLDLQLADIHNNATMSRPVLYAVVPIYSVHLKDGQ